MSVPLPVGAAPRTWPWGLGDRQPALLLSAREIFVRVVNRVLLTAKRDQEGR
jgi:hypothetical protein